MKRNKELAARNVKRDYLLRVYLYCAHCGRRYQGAIKTYRTKQGVKQYLYYRCSSSFRIGANPCCNHSRKAENLEAIIWQQIELALSNPEVILAGIEALREEASKADTTLSELALIQSRLTDLDKQQRKLLDNALRDFPEDLIKDENALINREREGLKQRQAEVKARLESARQAQITAESLEQSIKTVKANLTDLSFESKRLALEALNIRVTLSKDSITINGTVPVSHGVIPSTSSNLNGERMPSISACQLVQPGQSMPLD